MNDIGVFLGIIALAIMLALGLSEAYHRRSFRVARAALEPPTLPFGSPEPFGTDRWLDVVRHLMREGQHREALSRLAVGLARCQCSDEELGALADRLLLVLGVSGGRWPQTKPLVWCCELLDVCGRARGADLERFAWGAFDAVRDVVRGES
jgi:hypothetical protein